MDLFGYMKINKKDEKDKKGGFLIREVIVRLSNVIFFELYRSDMDFLNNKGFVDRIGEYFNFVNIE